VPVIVNDMPSMPIAWPLTKGTLVRPVAAPFLSTENVAPAAVAVNCTSYRSVAGLATTGGDVAAKNVCGSVTRPASIQAPALPGAADVLLVVKRPLPFGEASQAAWPSIVCGSGSSLATWVDPATPRN
jgi:hypothetical protein